ncbi:putative GTPase activating protein [Trypanosoma vivax]|nr:putative GTPase activating protein [Trypanosoma vivax]
MRPKVVRVKHNDKREQMGKEREGKLDLEKGVKTTGDSPVQSPRTLEDFIRVTGLKAEYAKKCFERFNGYAPALASFVQSHATLPGGYFEDKERAFKNADAINAELKLIYKKAREIRGVLGKDDRAVWQSYYASSAAPKSGPQKGLFGTVQSAADTAPSNFTFGFPSSVSAPVAGAGLNFGFGAVPTVPLSAPAAGGFGHPVKTEEKKNVASAAAEKPVQYCEASHDTGPFLNMPLFWKEEVDAICPLLNLNNGFLQENRSVLRARLEKWLSKAAFYRQPLRYVKIEDEDEETVRVIIKDADRTFFHPEHRRKFVAFLNAMSHEFKAYGQAMSYLAGICLLVLSEEETATVLRFVAKEYIPGHWAAEAVGFATSAWAVEYFMKKKFPDVAKHLDELKFWPDTYLQKILTGLCIHVLNFRELFEFLDLFMEGGIEFLIKFCLAIVEHFRHDILNIKSSVGANALYEIMRLDSKMCSYKDIVDILHRAPLLELDGEVSISEVRSMVYEERVAPRLERAPKAVTFEPCELCNERRPQWWNDEIGAVCSQCKEGAPGLDYTEY